MFVKFEKKSFKDQLLKSALTLPHKTLIYTSKELAFFSFFVHFEFVDIEDHPWGMANDEGRGNASENDQQRPLVLGLHLKAMETLLEISKRQQSKESSLTYFFCSIRTPGGCRTSWSRREWPPW